MLTERDDSVGTNKAVKIGLKLITDLAIPFFLSVSELTT